MSQYDFGTINPATKSGTALANDLNQWRNALHTLHRGASRPSYAQPGLLWIRDVSSTQWDLMLFDGAADVRLGQFNPSTNQWTLTSAGAAFLSVPTVPADGSGAPTLANHLVRKAYVDDAVNARLSIYGGTLQGQLLVPDSGVAFANDTDTGFGRSVSDTFRIITGNHERFWISNSAAAFSVPVTVGPSSDPNHAVRRSEVPSLVPPSAVRQVVWNYHNVNALTTSTSFVSTGASIGINISNPPSRVIVEAVVPMPRWEISFPTGGDGGGGGGQSAEFRWSSSLGNGPPHRLSGTFNSASGDSNAAIGGTWGAYGPILVAHHVWIAAANSYTFTLQMRITGAGASEVVETRANMAAILMRAWEFPP